MAGPLSFKGSMPVRINVSVVNVPLPSISADLGFSATDPQWMVNAYALTFAGYFLLGGRFADVYGFEWSSDDVFGFDLVTSAAPCFFSLSRK
jgi:MFS family permease